MLRAKKKITKKELKQDALVTSYMKATSFYEENKTKIGYGIAAVVVLILGFVFYANNQRSNEESASAALAKVIPMYDGGQFQLAVDGQPQNNVAGLKSIVDNYGGTPSGNLARFYLGGAYFQLGRYAEALEAFEDFDAPGPLLEISRLAGIAACYEALGKHAEAAKEFERAAVKHKDDPNVPENLSHAARNYALAGNKEKALELYKKLKKDFPGNPLAREADRFIAQLSV